MYVHNKYVPHTYISILEINPQEKNIWCQLLAMLCHSFMILARMESLNPKVGKVAEYWLCT